MFWPGQGDKCDKFPYIPVHIIDASGWEREVSHFQLLEAIVIGMKNRKRTVETFSL